MKVLVALFVITLLWGIVAVADACTCRPEPAPDDARRMATAVFEGMAVDKWMTIVWSPDAGRHMPVTIYRFQAARGWKGVTNADVRLMQGVGGCDIDFFAIGSRYLVFATAEERPTRLVALGCMPLLRNAQVPPYAASLGSPALSFANADQVSVASVLPLTRSLRAYLVVGLAACSELSSLEWRWFFGDPTAAPWLTPAAEAPLRIVWRRLAASGAALCGGLIAFVKRRRRLALGLACIAGFIVVVGIAYAGQTSIRTNAWLESALLWNER